MRVARLIALGAACLWAFAVSGFAVILCVETAWAQGVTLAELEGAVIDVTAVNQEKAIRNGNLIFPAIHMTGHFTLGAGGTISTQVQSTAHGPWGARAGATRSGTYSIGKAGRGQQGNDEVWLFSNGELRKLAVHHEGGAGGSVMTIAFRRGPDGLRCSFSLRMARENGVGAIRKDAAIDDAPIQILEFKPVSSSCQVSKR
jgi:hypothetical protein